MALDASANKDKETNRPSVNGNSVAIHTSYRLNLNPNFNHKPESYDDLQLEFNPLVFSSLECYLPENLLNCSRDHKAQYMRDLLLRYSPEGERFRVQRHKEYRDKILSTYRPLQKELYTMSPDSFLVPSFLSAIKENSEASFRRIIVEPIPGVFTFEMLQPQFCEMLLREVEHFEKWIHDTRSTVMRPNTMNQFGVVLDDFGLESVLDKFVDDFIKPISKGDNCLSISDCVFIPELYGSTLDSHHGFVVEYGEDRDLELGFHVDDSEVTLNVCLGGQFSGGDLYFRGVRCDKHVNSECHAEEFFDYSHVPGHAVLHRGRHRHGARATVSGHRVNMLLWCKSSLFRELRKYQKDFSSWCGECRHEKRKRQRVSIAATQQKLLERQGRSSF